MSEAATVHPPSRLAGVVGTVDRYFPLLWIGMYLLLPVSGWASETFESWFDQRRDLEALESLLATGRADAIADSVIGPAYIGAAAVLHELFGLSPESSLVALTRASYVLSVAAGLLLVRVLATRLTSAPPMISLASQLAFVALVFAAGTWYWSDVPWSHFFAAFLGVGVYLARFAPARSTWISAAAVGVLLALLAATRSFELVSLVLAWMLAAVLLAVLRLQAGRPAAARVAAGALAFVATTGVIYLGTGKRDLFFLYSNHLDRQSGDVAGAEIAETPTLTFATVPTKLVQLLVDPCYYSLCSLSDYEVGGGSGSNVDLWSLPLAVQLPALVLLPACVVAVAVLLLRAVRRRSAWSARGRELRLALEMTIAAGGLVVGYAASTLSGSTHLRYGFARDFLLAALLTAIVAASLGGVAMWSALSRQGAGRVSAEGRFLAVTVGVVVVAVAGSVVARSKGLPRIESKHLESITYVASCSDHTCVVRIDARTPGGERISIPERSTLTFGCGSARPVLSVYVSSLSNGGVRVPTSCAAPRLVAAWPTVMGLPPGSGDLRAVRVESS